MRFLEKSLRFFLVVTLAAFCFTVVQADTWNEIINGGGDAGDFPTGDFQMAPDDGIVYDVITGNNDALLGGDATGFDAYLITVTDAATFYVADTSGDISDTKSFVWDAGGNPVWSVDDNPLNEGGDFSMGFGNGLAHPGAQVGMACDGLENGDTVVLTVGKFTDTADSASGGFVFLDDGGDFSAMTGPTGEKFSQYTVGGGGPGGPYNIVLTGCQVASSFGSVPACTGGGGGCDNDLGDLNGDGTVDLLDVAPFVDAIIAGTFVCEGDINEDGVVDLLDVQPFIDILL